MNESLKNTQTILNQTDHGLGATRTLQEEVDKEEVASILVPKSRTSDANLGEEYLHTLDQNANALPIMSLSETVKNEIGKEAQTRGATESSGMQPVPPQIGLNGGGIFNNTDSPLKKSRRRKPRSPRKKPYPKGAEMIGLSPGFQNGRQMTWERMNNDKHLKHNIKNLKSRFSQKGKVTPKTAERRRLRRDQKLKLKLLNRDNIERCEVAFRSFSKNNSTNFSVQVKHAMTSKKSRVNFFTEVRKTIDLYSLENLEVLRFWFEIIFHAESFDTLERFFPLTLKKMFEKHRKIRNDAEILLMSYLERRLAVQEEVYNKDKAMVLFRYLYELRILPGNVVREWRSGIMPERRELQVVPGMRFQDGVLTIARSKVDSFLAWVDVVEKEAIDQKLRIRNASKINKAKVQGPFKNVLPAGREWLSGMKKI